MSVNYRKLLLDEVFKSPLILQFITKTLDDDSRIYRVRNDEEHGQHSISYLFLHSRPLCVVLAYEIMSNYLEKKFLDHTKKYMYE